MENVSPLDHTNFTTTVANGRWIVVFYRKSCGHCIAYSTPFSQAALHAKNWSWLVHIGAIDCEEPQNSQTCYDYKIPGVPTIKLFINGNVTSEIETYSDPSQLIAEMAKSLFPEITKISDENKAKEKTIVVTSSSSENNLLLILDYAASLKLPMVSDVEPTATLMTVKAWGGMIIARGTFEEVQRSLSSLVELKVNESVPDDKGKDVGKPTDDTVSPKFTPVYAADIYRSLSMLLTSDVSARMNITGEDMDALKEFISMLSQTLPASAEYIRALNSLNTWLTGRKVTTGQEWYEQLRIAKLPIFTGDFIACKGSQPYLRGYPCGLWLLWHSLTVNHYLTLPGSPGDLVAHAMHRFMPRFFSCLYCAFHFALNSANLARPGESLLPQNRPAPLASEFTWDPKVIPTLPSPPTTASEEVIWLNLVHNRVNKRLSGSPTDDPTAPKIVFPPVTVCTSCWAKPAAGGELSLGGTQESRLILLNFLVTMYRPSSWQTVGLPSNFFSSMDALPRHATELMGKRPSTYSDLFIVAILSVLLTAFSVVMILFVSRFLWRYRRGRRTTIS